MGLLWEGARAIGLHPWHPDVQNLAPYQLWWAVLQARQDSGLAPRKGRKEAEMLERSKAAGEMVAWADRHVDRGRR